MMRVALAGLALAATLSVPALARDAVDVADLVEKHGPAVVNISTTKLVRREGDLPFVLPDEEEMRDFFRRFFPPGGPDARRGPMREIPSRGEGSGFIVSADGYILTNAHVVRNADEVVVKLVDKRTFTARVVGTDVRTDVAVLKIPAGNLPTVRLGDPDRLRVGEAVVAIGSPFGFEHSVTAGIVSAKGRSLPSENYVPYIQTDVAINPGNSGGPLFNTRGEVVGINSQIYSRSGGFQGVSFAIPIDVAMDVVRQIKETGRVTRGWLGVAIQEVTAGLAESFGLDRARGALVSQVQPDSPASRAGLQAADVILEFGGRPVENSGDLPRMVGMAKPGVQTPVTVWRKGKSVRLNVVLGEMPTETVRAETPGRGISRGGLVLSELNAEQRRALDLPHGLRVEEATGDAARAGIRPGDIILTVGNASVSTVEAFRNTIAAVPAGRSIAVLVRRGDNSLFIPLRVSGE